MPNPSITKCCFCDLRTNSPDVLEYHMEENHAGETLREAKELLTKVAEDPEFLECIPKSGRDRVRPAG